MTARVENFHCLKCGGYVELLYLPHIDTNTKEYFNNLQEAQLCPKCKQSFSCCKECRPMIN